LNAAKFECNFVCAQGRKKDILPAE